MNRNRPLDTRNRYLKKVYKATFTSLTLIAISLFMGMLGYKLFAHLSWIDSLLNASMILTGMGPVDTLTNNAAKIFASFYAIYSGVSFLTIIAVLFAPVYQRFLHKFHIYISQEEEAKER